MAFVKDMKMIVSTENGLHVLAEKCTFSGNPSWSSGTLGLLLGDHLVTMGEHINPWGAM